MAVDDAVFEQRKIILIGYAFDVPDGPPMIGIDGMPVDLVKVPIRMRLAFWIPQPKPWRPRPIGTRADYVRQLQAQPVAQPGSSIELGKLGVSTLDAYLRENRFDLYLMNLAENVPTHTMVANASKYELELLRAGALLEHLQDFTFPRQPTLEELRTHSLQHWNMRTLNSLGFIPNAAPVDRKPAPVILLESADPPVA